jgi:hypothetical protein
MPKPRLLFLSLANDPGSDRIIAAMARLGADCGAVGPAGAFALRSRFVGDTFALGCLSTLLPQSLSLAPRLRHIVRSWRPDLLVPLDDLASRVLRDPRLSASDAEFAHLIERSLGRPAHFDVACSRNKLTELAKRIGIRTPREAAIQDLDAALRAAALTGYPAVLKREQTCGGVGVAIVRDEAELRRIFRKALLRASAKRCLGFLPGFRASEANPLTLQSFVPGTLAFTTLACAGGTVLELASFKAECRNPPDTGASTVISAFANQEMAEASRRLVEALGCSGFVSFDFILSPDEKACLIEMNARPIATGHLGRLYGHDIYAAMIAHLEGFSPGPIDASEGPLSVALFPRELDRDPASALVDRAEALHDIPFDDPPVIEACVTWLEKRHPRERALLHKRLEAAAQAPRMARPAEDRSKAEQLPTGKTASLNGLSA